MKYWELLVKMIEKCPPTFELYDFLRGFLVKKKIQPWDVYCVAKFQAERRKSSSIEINAPEAIDMAIPKPREEDLQHLENVHKI